MTKKHEPEFTDYASADAWLKAGRNPDRRATRYGWNTELRRESDGLVMYLHGEPILRYDSKPSAVVALTSRVLPHVTRERLNMYMFGPRGLSVSAMGRIASMVPRRTLLHPTGPPIAVPIDTYAVGWKYEDGQALTAKHMGWWDGAFDLWITSVRGFLDRDGILPPSPGKPNCHECTQLSPIHGARWGHFGGVEHLFAHVTNREYIPELIMQVTSLRGKLTAVEITQVITDLRTLVQASVPLHKGDS